MLALGFRYACTHLINHREQNATLTLKVMSQVHFVIALNSNYFTNYWSWGVHFDIYTHITSTHLWELCDLDLLGQNLKSCGVEFGVDFDLYSHIFGGTKCDLDL